MNGRWVTKNGSLRWVRELPKMNPLEVEFYNHLRRVGLSPTVQPSIMSDGLAAANNHRAGVCKPDFLWPFKRVALFLDGCYWHECPIHSPDAHGGRVREKDARQNAALTADFWLVLRFWGHDRPEFDDIAQEVKDIVTARPLERRRTYQIKRDLIAQEAQS